MGDAAVAGRMLGGGELGGSWLVPHQHCDSILRK